jgi:hypothetical protein
MSKRMKKMKKMRGGGQSAAIYPPTHAHTHTHKSQIHPPYTILDQVQKT